MSSPLPSSFHLVWQLPKTARKARLVEASAVLEIITPPTIPAVYFWALQVDFLDGLQTWGGGHTGLQWNPRYPGSTAVNWGGYASPQVGGAVLPGTVSSLPGFEDDPNTLSYPWQPGVAYRFRVYRSPEIPGAWRAEISDLKSGEVTVIRDLRPGARRRRGLMSRLVSGNGGWPEGGEDGCLARPIVWTEVFAECDAPSVKVRWTDLAAIDESGTVVRPQMVRVNYQSRHEGGCLNTNVRKDNAGGLLQITNVSRTVEQGSYLSLS